MSLLERSKWGNETNGAPAPSCHAARRKRCLRKLQMENKTPVRLAWVLGTQVAPLNIYLRAFPVDLFLRKMLCVVNKTVSYHKYRFFLSTIMSSALCYFSRASVPEFSTSVYNILMSCMQQRTSQHSHGSEPTNGQGWRLSSASDSQSCSVTHSSCHYWPSHLG